MIAWTRRVTEIQLGGKGLVRNFTFYDIYDNLAIMEFTIKLDLSALIFIRLLKKLRYFAMMMPYAAVDANDHCLFSCNVFFIYYRDQWRKPVIRLALCFL